MTKSKTLWSLVSYVRISKYREDLLIELSKKPHFPSELVRKLDITFSVVSRTLKELEDRGIIVCLNPEQKKGKLFSISNLGEELISLLQSSF
ncbi:MAG: ArsR family transcriptional regulator [Promethearchaeota archaeon]